ncbi:hypothetical protein CcCBS67573_g04587 [Chytriomyces confervae]|uniref:AB hydrolase-1 domain-containing protein n=1 Tax=Chytriomyces confervae TaxID=246404 RepID=A0A507FCW6_9FUNG|nr:hypothetical protein CcCBS67573_g04587 [Chytriomyces confervae]
MFSFNPTPTLMYIPVDSGVLPVHAWQQTPDASNITHLSLFIHGIDRKIMDPFVPFNVDQRQDQVQQDMLAIWAPLFPYNTSSSSSDDSAETADTLLTWKRGASYAQDAPSTSIPTTTSFHVLDTLIDTAITRFPSLKSIHLVGFSAGAQFVNRYAALSTHLETVARAVRVKLVFGTSSSWLYLDSRRVLQDENTPLPTCDTQIPQASFQTPTESEAPRKFNAWKYGLENAPTSDSDATITSRFLAYNMVFIYVVDDDQPGDSLDVTDACLVQGGGTSRYARMCVYVQYLRTCWNKVVGLETVVVDGCGHDARKVYSQAAVQRLVYSAGAV